MQMQEYLRFFQELSLQYFQFTLENSVYATCLAIVVWLLTAIFYSFRIGFLNRRNRATLKTALDAQNAVTAAQQEIQQLQAEIAAGKEQLEQETQRTAAVEERINALAGQLSDSIVSLASQPDLGQQGLSVSPGLEVEHLWQRFSAAVKQIGEALIAQRRTNQELQQACDAEKAKLAEKDSQLQATQTRLDSQRQQLAKLEQTIEEQKAQLALQQDAQQRMAEVEAKHQADLLRLAALEQQARDSITAKLQPVAQEKPKVVDTPVVLPEPVKPVEVTAEVPKPAPATPEPQAVSVEAKPTAVRAEAAAPAAPTMSRVEEAKQKPQAPKAKSETSAGTGGKFKAWFAGAKQQMEKLDDMFGLNTPMLPPEEPKDSVRGQRPPLEAPVAVEVESKTAAEPLPKTEAQQSGAGLGGKFKNLFGSSKTTPLAEPIVEQPAEPVVEEIKSVEPDQAVSESTPGKLKGLFGKFKKGA